MLLTVVRLMTTVLYTFVTLVMFTVVLVMFTLFTYARLTWYPGTETSPGASGNHPTPTPAEKRKPGPPPTNATIAGAHTGRTTTGPGTQNHPPLTDAQRP